VPGSRRRRHRDCRASLAALVAVEERLLRHERHELQVDLGRPLQVELVVRPTDRIVGRKAADVLQVTDAGWNDPRCVLVVVRVRCYGGAAFGRGSTQARATCTRLDPQAVSRCSSSVDGLPSHKCRRMSPIRHGPNFFGAEQIDTPRIGSGMVDGPSRWRRGGDRSQVSGRVFEGIGRPQALRRLDFTPVC
jgi:hypothetical protein